MGRVTDATTSDSDAERHRVGSTKKKYSAKKARRTSVDAAEPSDAEGENKLEGASGEGPEDDAEDGPEEEEVEEEYEIEAILDAKKGQFPNGRMGYLVKWKNYGEEHNSWVDEVDAANAQELIEDFWAKRRRNKPGPRKSEPIRSKPRNLAAKVSRKSLAQESSPETEAPSKKRGRPKKTIPESESEMVIDDEESRATKKARKNEGTSRKAADKPESGEEVIVGDMKKHMQISSWEHLVETVDTVERNANGDLFVYFTLKNDMGRKRENSRVCAEKFPQKLIKFYESNLRWKIEDGEGDE
ncbi:hypothetical protein EDD17DRAFT_1469034 [Pisolithus thermaeus]|nr:hypothetical protein EV401DRAFT_1941580 [Pisolithus croceorrhizus]KAI6167345.1 hypothetical protein EDD17DRAFT_1469034 [Pisolithus thermaeus]